ncbi:MAG TPA: hypothetical protein PLW86_14990 [Rhodocyclaceae bacterium]|nr:hypothetical protein [Rhodocyclaceae bacterium]
MSAAEVDRTAVRKTLQAAMAKCGDHGVAYPQAVENEFPRILARITELWGTPELDFYFDGLLTTNRHDRHGFPEQVALQLFRLANLHSTLRLSSITRKSPWDWSEEHDLLNKPSS